MLALLCFESKNNGGGKTTTSSFWRAQPNVCSSKICLPFWLDFSWTQELEAPWPAPVWGLTSELNEHSFLCWWQTPFCCFKVFFFFFCKPVSFTDCSALWQVVCMSFFDIVLDFILMDAFEDLENPPSSVLAVLRNRWLSDSFKETVGSPGSACVQQSQS